MTSEELQRIATGCLEFLARWQNDASRKASEYLSYLVVATLCYGMAPRQQVLRQLRLGSSFVKAKNGLYTVLMLAHMNKNGKATTFSLAKELTSAFDFYLDTVRPQLLGDQEHDFVFCLKTGELPTEHFSFSSWTRDVTSGLIGRPINAHAFRGGIVTTFYNSGATQVEMDALSDVMNHDPATARNHYYRADNVKRLEGIHERLRGPLSSPTSREAEAEMQGITREPPVGALNPPASTTDQVIAAAAIAPAAASN